MTEAEINAALSYGAAGLRILSILFPAIAPVAAVVSTCASVAPEVEDAAAKIEASIRLNAGVVTADHLAAVNDLATAQASGLRIYADPPA